MYLVTYVSAETCNVQPEAPKVQKPNIQVYKSNLEYVHPMISTPPKSPPIIYIMVLHEGQEASIS